MGLFGDDKPPPLFVPSDLSKPAGAAVDADGNVTCVGCGAKLPVAKADIVGQGYRCAPCTARAHVASLSTGADDNAANLSAGDREELRAFGMKFVLSGIGATLLGAVLTPFVRKGIALLVAGACMIGFGIVRVRAAR